MSNEKFEVGKIYETISICDSDCRFRYKVIARTSKTVTVYDLALERTSKRGILKGESEFWGCEAIRPCGSYSMAPILTAKDVVAA